MACLSVDLRVLNNLNLLQDFLFLRVSRKKAKKRTHFADQAWDLFEPPSKTSAITPQNATELIFIKKILPIWKT